MRVGVLGTGDVGRVLASGLVGIGHDVRMGSRDAGKARAWADGAGPRASAGTFAEAAADAELVVLATHWQGTENALRLAGGPAALAGKIVIDATNPLDFSTGSPRLALGHTDSGGEQVQRWLPGAKVVKAFNTVGNGLMVDPKLPGGPPTMFICGNDEGAKKVVAGICDAFHHPALDVGGIEAARLLEPLAMLWVLHGFRSGTWNHAFKLLRG